jgi:hypothetical protein
MIAPSRLKNAITKCHLDDWLKLYGKKNGYTSVIKTKKRKRSSSNIEITNRFQKNGNIFEDKVVKYLKELYEVVQITHNAFDLTKQNCIKTYIAMEIGTEIIYQGALMDVNQNLHGIPDFLIRSDIVSDIFTGYEYPHKNEGAFNGKQFHYVVVDAKFSKLQLCADGMRIRNSDQTRFYKVQTWIYNTILGSMQGYQPKLGLVIGNGYSFTKKGCTSSSKTWLDRPGIVDFDNKDKFVQDDLISAMDWYNRLSCKTASDWQISPIPETEELYSNPKKGEDKWKKARTQIAEEQDDIALMWNCNEKNREIAKNNGYFHAKNVTNCKDIGFKSDSKRGKTLTTIIKVNQSGKEHVNIDINDLPDHDKEQIYYLDFETINRATVVIGDTTSEIRNYVYLIGLTDQKGNYNSFKLEQFTPESEAKMTEEWLDFLVCHANDKPITIVHWGNAEVMWMNHLVKCHSNTDTQVSVGERITNLKENTKMFDMCSYFLNKNIVYPGQKDFSLKSVTNAMHSLKYIKSSYTGLECMSGDQSMELMEKILSDKIVNLQNHVNYGKLLAYNAIDCIVLLEILSHLKKSNK